MKKVMSNVANVRDSIVDIVPTLIGTEVPYNYLDYSTRNAIISDIMIALSIEMPGAIKIATEAKYELMDGDSEDFPYRVIYEVNVPEGTKILYSEDVGAILKEYGATDESMDFIVEQVRRINNKLELILSSISEREGVEASWRDLNPAIIRSLLDIYDRSPIDLITREIIVE